MATLIIAEKPSVAKTIADTIGAGNRKDGYFEGAGYYVSWAFGHLFTLFDAKDYDDKYAAWSVETLPIIPENFQYKIVENAGIKKQFKTINNLANSGEVKEIINACDSDREGSLIFSEIYQMTNCKKPFKRLWVSSHTPEDLKEGFKKIRAGSDDMPLILSGHARQWADWLFGINHTIAATKLFSADGKMLNIGRVILPTVNLIYIREKEIKNFVSKKLFSLTATFKTGKGNYEGIYLQDKKTNFENDTQLNDALKSLKLFSGKAIITACESKTTFKGAPRLFNLTDLQGHITSKYDGFTADKVLNIAQSLYEKRYITYPRTASRYLDDTQKDASEAVLRALKPFFEGIALTFHTNKTVFDSGKVDSHPALSPTYLIPKKTDLTADEQIIYTEISKRFCALFAPAAEYLNTTAETKAADFTFLTKVKSLITAGWLALYGGAEEKDTEKENNEDVEEQKITFTLEKGLTSSVNDLKINNKDTKPPSRYTVKTLLTAMQNCGKNVENENEILKGYSIGTSATRAEALKKIENIEYVQLKGKSYYMTALGTALIETFPLKEKLEADYTGKLEFELKEIEQRRLLIQDFLKSFTAILKTDIERLKGTTAQIQREIKSIGKCPECGREIVESPKAFGCTGYKDKTAPCKFTLWKEDKFLGSMGKKLTVSAAKKLLENKPAIFKGMKSKSGKIFDAKLKLVKQTNGYYSYEFVKD